MIDVIDGGPADRAGVRPTDVIVTVDGTPTEDAGDLQRLMVSDVIGRRLCLGVLRADKLVEIEVVPAEL